MKGVIYARYSSDNQREESIDGRYESAAHLPSETALILWIAI